MKGNFSFSGIVTFSAIGAYTEEFITELLESGIRVRNISNKNKIIYINAKRTDYLKIARIAAKHRVRTRITERQGLYFKLKRKSHHAGIIAGIAAAAAVLIILRQFIWEIEIYGNNKLSENLILETISQDGIQIGRLVSSIDPKGTELRLKGILENISWINIEVNGSRIDVYIRESEDVDKTEIPLKTPCNVIAEKTGIIVDTQVYSGTLLYPKGSGISKGNIVVSGVVNDGAGNLILSHANAKIIAEFTETAEFRQEFTTTEKIKSEISESEKELMILGFVIPYGDKVTDKTNTICSEQINVCSLFGFELPWKTKTNIYTKYKDISVTRTTDDAIKLAEQKLELYCRNFYSDYDIIDIKKSIKCDDYGVTLSAEIRLMGDIAIQQAIINN